MARMMRLLWKVKDIIEGGKQVMTPGVSSGNLGVAAPQWAHVGTPQLEEIVFLLK